MIKNNSKIFNHDFLKNIIKLPRNIRRLILLLIDIICIFIIVIISNLLLNKFSGINIIEISRDAFIFSSICIPIYFLTGQYKGVTKFISVNHIYYCFLRNLLTALIISLIKESNLIYLFSISISNSFLSFFIRTNLSNLIKTTNVSIKKNIVVYGAGSAGVKLANSLILNRENNILFFVDDDHNLLSRSIFGIPIKNPKDIEKYADQIDVLFLAISNLDQNKKKEILNKLYDFSFKVLIIPPLDDILSGKSKITETRSVILEDLISRDLARLNRNNLIKEYKEKTILITGAGGSIGSEITRQILQFNPQKLIIVDFSEFNLYSLKNDLLKKRKEDIELVFILGDCCDEKLINNLLKKYSIDFLIHCAAYKHVPLVEENPLVGLSNNILSTKILCDAAIKNNIKKVLLVSTDKAVRPTNVMGASKRVAELIFLNSQNLVLFKEPKSKTKFSIVRFGNVLGSSGSVVPYFINQIKNGGPITITHPEITRYFMTIREATLLVLEASSLSKGGELFLLDMGKPLKILDLAKKLIKFNGLKIKDSSNINGDLEIKFIGLRKGEKLYEELLIDGEAKKTRHENIFLGKESRIKLDNKKSLLIDQLITSLKKQEEANALNLLKTIVPEWVQEK